VDLFQQNETKPILDLIFYFTFYLFGEVCTHRTHPTAHGPEIRVETAGQTDTTDRITFPANSQ